MQGLLWLRKGRLTKLSAGMKKNMTVNAYVTVHHPFYAALLCKHLTDLQKDAIRIMDFGPMLDIKCTTLHNPLIYWFANLYDKKTREFVVPSRGRIPLNEAAARRTLGLPIGSVPVPYRTDGRLEHSLAPVVFPEDCKTTTTSRVWEILKDMDDDGDIFKQIYAMYLVSTVLSPTTRNHISNRRYPIMVSSSFLIAYVSCKVLCCG
jgi:hypothetical protein